MLLEVKNIQVFYAKSHILKGVSLQVGRGEIVALLGRNGAGKTTTLRSIIGLTGLRAGSILFDGVVMDKMPPFRRSRKGLGYVPQGKLLFTRMTVKENLKAAARGEQSGKSWDLVYQMFPALRERANQKAGTLSGGEQQMLSIARTLLTNPQLLLLDEPSTGLMPVMIARLAEVIKRLHQTGISIFLVEEQIPLAMELASRLYILDVGRVVYAGDASGVSQEDLLMKYLGVSCAPS